MVTNQRVAIFLFCLCLNPPQISSSVCDTTTQKGSKGDFFQIVFVYDLNQEVEALRSDFVKAIENTMRNLISSGYERSEIAIVSHGKFLSAKDDSSCYGHISPFDTDETKMGDKVNGAAAARTINDATGYFSPLSAVCLAAQDEFLGWHRGKTDGKGKIIRRLIVFYAVQDNYFGTNSPANYLDYGYVSQDCKRLEPLDYRSIRGILRDKDVAVVGIYDGEELKELYDLHFMTFSVQYCSKSFDSTKKSNLADKMTEAVADCITEIVA